MYNVGAELEILVPLSVSVTREWYIVWQWPLLMRSKQPMRDPDLRGAVRQRLLAPLYFDPHTLVVEELGLRHGAARIDIAVINGQIHGFELKSAQDTLRRLPKQVTVYNSVLDRITLVVTPHHVDQASEIIPNWWGIMLAEGEASHEIEFTMVRESCENPELSALAISKLLWRNEALHLLEDLGAADGVRSKPRRIIYRQLVELLDLPRLQACVRSCLKSRKDWRFGG